MKPKELIMVDTVKKMDELSKDDRAVIFDALHIKAASLRRSLNTEKDPEVRALRESALARTVALQGRFL